MITELTNLLVDAETAQQAFDELSRLERQVEERQADVARYEAELARLEATLPRSNPLATGQGMGLVMGGGERPEIVLDRARSRLHAALNARDSLIVERDSLARFIQRHVLAPEPEPEPPVDELAELEAGRQALAYDAAQGDQAAAKKLAEVEGRISSIRLERERAVLVAAEAARREAEAERERQAAERAAQEARCAQLEAALRECYLAVERATDQLISAVQQAIEPWIELDTLRAQLGRPRERWIKHRLHDRIARRLNVEAGLTWFELGDPVLAPPLAEPDPPKPAFEAEQPDQPDQPEEPDDLPPAA